MQKKRDANKCTSIGWLAEKVLPSWSIDLAQPASETALHSASLVCRVVAMAPKRAHAKEKEHAAPADDAVADGGDEPLPHSTAVAKLTVPVLRGLCARLGLPADGLKGVLVDRVRAELEQRENGGDADGAGPDAGKEAKEPAAEMDTESAEEKSKEEEKEEANLAEEKAEEKPEAGEQETAPDSEKAQVAVDSSSGPAHEPDSNAMETDKDVEIDEPKPEKVDDEATMEETEPADGVNDSAEPAATEPEPEQEKEPEKEPEPMLGVESSKKDAPESEPAGDETAQPVDMESADHVQPDSNSPWKKEPAAKQSSKRTTEDTAEDNDNAEPQPKRAKRSNEPAEGAIEPVSEDAKHLRSLALKSLRRTSTAPASPAVSSPVLQSPVQQTVVTAFSEASQALQISGFTRPLHLPSLKGKLEEFGDVESFWIDNVRSKCVVLVGLELNDLQEAELTAPFAPTIHARISSQHPRLHKRLPHFSKTPCIRPSELMGGLCRVRT